LLSTQYFLVLKGMGHSLEISTKNRILLCAGKPYDGAAIMKSSNPKIEIADEQHQKKGDRTHLQ